MANLSLWVPNAASNLDVVSQGGRINRVEEKEVVLEQGKDERAARLLQTDGDLVGAEAGSQTPSPHINSFWGVVEGKELKQAGLTETLNLYSLRHSCATLLLAAGVNPKIVSERLGPASIVLTLDTYSHVLPDMQQSAADKPEKILFSEVGTPEAHQKEKAAC